MYTTKTSIHASQPIQNLLCRPYHKTQMYILSTHHPPLSSLQALMANIDQNRMVRFLIPTHMRSYLGLDPQRKARQVISHPLASVVSIRTGDRATPGSSAPLGRCEDERSIQRGKKCCSQEIPTSSSLAQWRPHGCQREVEEVYPA